MNHLKKIITKQSPAMLNEDYSTIDDDIPLWINHENIEFKTTHEMMTWISDDKINFSLSDKVYDAMMDCLENNIERIIVATIIVENQTLVNISIRKQNFQKIFSSYVDRLMKVERYEKLAEIKKEIKKYGLEI